MNIEQGLDFLQDHFESGYPRTISTHKTQNKQVKVYSKEEALKYFRESYGIDCRISAFGMEEIEQEKPNLIFADLDDNSALDEVKALFYKTIGGIPTILHTGNGHAVIQPISMVSLNDSIIDGVLIESLGKKFLQFAERHLTNSRCDPGNHPSLRSCMIRVPGSCNSKCINNGNYENASVTIVQEWDGKRCNVRNLPFKEHLKKIARFEQTRQSRIFDTKGEIPYIENILEHDIVDGRKRIFALILCPYLVNIKKLPLGEAEKIISKCFGGYIPTSVIRYKLKEVLKKGVLPYNLKNMKVNDSELYHIITSPKLNCKNMQLVKPCNGDSK